MSNFALPNRWRDDVAGSSWGMSNWSCRDQTGRRIVGRCKRSSKAGQPKRRKNGIRAMIPAGA